MHPSLLPDLRGPAPLQHTLLAGLARTGVSLQTLSDEAFDAGLVLAQTPLPGVPVPADCTVARLGQMLAPLGAEMLVRALRDGLHVPPLEPAGWVPGPEDRARLRHAPKITTADRRVDWVGGGGGGAGLAARARVLGPLWGWALYRSDGDGGEERRVILEGVEVTPREQWPEGMVRLLRAAAEARDGAAENGGAEVDVDAAGLDLGVVTWVQQDAAGEGNGTSTSTRHVDIPYFPDGETIIVPAARGGCVRIRSIKVEGGKSRPAATAIGAFSKKYTGRGAGPWDSIWQALPGADALTLPIEAGLKHLLP